MSVRPTSARVMLGGLVALLLGLVFVILGTQRLARWEVVEVRDPARIRLSDGAFRPGGLQAGQTLGPTLIDTDRDSALTLRLDDLLVLRMSPDTSLTLPPPPARWIGRHRRLFVDKGEVVLTSGARVLGRRLAVGTEAGVIELSGADLVLRCAEGRTDVCLLRGAVTLMTPTGRVHRLRGEIGLRFGGEAEPVTIPVDEQTRGLLTALPRPD